MLQPVSQIHPKGHKRRVPFIDLAVVPREHRIDLEQSEDHRPLLPVHLDMDRGELGHVVGAGGNLLSQFADLVFEWTLGHGGSVAARLTGRTRGTAIEQVSAYAGGEVL